MNAGLEENLKAKMNLQQSAHPRSSVNGYGRRKGDREIGPKAESKMHTGKVASSSFGTAENGGKSGSVINPSRDRLIYVISYLIGLRVEVHVRNGSIISGIFHATNAEKDFSIVLKMAQVIKDGSVRGHKPVPETVKKPMDMIIQAKDLVQVVAEDAPLNIEEFSNAHPRDKRKDLMIDSAISHSHHLEAERELERWTPDADDPECPELEDIFDGTWNRNWDQFQTNETLFGVKSTFDEELYTTKLERGPRTRELEREATRIAREIEGEDTRDLHLAEERGIQFDEDFDVDEEIKYSAVQREMDDQISNNYSTENFGSSNGSTVPRSFSDISRSKLVEEAHTSPTCSSMNAEAPAEIHYDKDVRHFGFGSKDDNIPSADIVGQKPQAVNDKSRLHEKQTKNEDKEKNIFNECIKRTAPEKAQESQDEVTQSSADAEKSCSSTVASIASASSQDGKRSIGEASDCTSVAIEAVDHSHRSRTALSSTSDRIAAGSVSSGSGLSPSSSIGSLPSEKSTLNPNARILIDGVPLGELDIKWLREKIGFVGQEPRLFRMDVASNIKYGCAREVRHEEVEWAAKQAYAHEFIMSLPNGYETLVDNSLLSGGQKQRIAIARAILRDPNILLLDEATSALDTESEHYIKGILRNAKAKSSVIVIAHRLSTIQAADRIIVMDSGRIVEMGDHAELIRKSGLYARLANRQVDALA